MREGKRQEEGREKERERGRGGGGKCLFRFSLYSVAAQLRHLTGLSTD